MERLKDSDENWGKTRVENYFLIRRREREARKKRRQRARLLSRLRLQRTVEAAKAAPVIIDMPCGIRAFPEPFERQYNWSPRSENASRKTRVLLPYVEFQHGREW